MLAQHPPQAQIRTRSASNPAITQSTGRELGITHNKLLEKYRIAPIENPRIIRGLTLARRVIYWCSIGTIVYRNWIGIRSRVAIASG